MKSRLIICIDGLGFDLVSKENTPFLYEFGAKNYFSELKTLFAFTGLEYCFFSGETPDKNNIWLEFANSKSSIFDNRLLNLFSFNRKLRDYLAAILQYLKGRTWISGLYHIPKEKLKYFDTSAKQGLWKLDFFQDKNFVFYKWPFFVTSKNNTEKIKIILKYESDSERLERLLSKKGKNVYYVQIMGIDKAIHKFGKNSLEAKNSLMETDRILKKYITKFLEENSDGKIFLWSDHGFADVKECIDLEKLLPKSKDYIYFIGGTTASFWFRDKKREGEVIKLIKKNKKIKILTEKLAKKYKIPLSKKYGELVLFIDVGNYFFPNFYQKNEKEKYSAMHGYPSELNGILMSNKKIPEKIIPINQAKRYLE